MSAPNNILVAFGGVSPEHEVSVLTAHQAIATLQEQGRSVRALYISKSGRWFTGDALLDLKSFEDLNKLEARSLPCTFGFNEYGRAVLQTEAKGWFSKSEQFPVDVVLTAFHGSEGENGSFQGVFEAYNLPYTGAGVAGSAIGMDKPAAKDICRAHDIPVVDDIIVTESSWSEHSEQQLAQIENLGFPVFIKPSSLGSSIGVHKAETKQEAEEAIETAFRFDRRLMVEKAVTPLTEINCSVLGNLDDCRPSVCEQPLGNEELLSFEDKYMSGSEDGSKGMASADRKIPAPISEEQTRKIQNLACRIFAVLNCSGVARLDFLVNSDTGEVYFNELNSIPGSFSFYLWEETDLSFQNLIDELIEIALKRHREKNGRVRSYETNLLSEKAVKGIKGMKQNKS